MCKVLTPYLGSKRLLSSLPAPSKPPNDDDGSLFGWQTRGLCKLAGLGVLSAPTVILGMELLDGQQRAKPAILSTAAGCMPRRGLN